MTLKGKRVTLGNWVFEAFQDLTALYSSSRLPDRKSLVAAWFLAISVSTLRRG